MKRVIVLVIASFSISCHAMDQAIQSLQKEQSTTAPLHVLDGVRIVKFVSDSLPQEMQEPFVEKISTDECAKIATNFEKDHADLYKKAIESITSSISLSKEDRQEFLIQILAYGFMYRAVKSQKHKEEKHQSIKKAQTAKKTSIGTAIVSGIITVGTNLLQHFLSTKK